MSHCVAETVNLAEHVHRHFNVRVELPDVVGTALNAGCLGPPLNNADEIEFLEMIANPAHYDGIRRKFGGDVLVLGVDLPGPARRLAGDLKGNTAGEREMILGCEIANTFLDVLALDNILGFSDQIPCDSLLILVCSEFASFVEIADGLPGRALVLCCKRSTQ